MKQLIMLSFDFPFTGIISGQFQILWAISILNIFAYQMSRSIKMEEQDCPLSSDQALFNHCLTTFYDNDSEEIIQAKCSAQDVFQILEHSVDLCDTPLADIMRIVQQNAAFRGVDAELVRQKVIKRKYLLKRMRAKDRKAIAKERRIVVEMAVSGDHEEQFKKQRNRMSAQISRDKKKQKVKALEELNQQLQRQCERQRKENEQLRAEMEKASQKNSETPFKSKITKLLIVLGIVFLIGLLKDFFNPQSNSTIPLTKINQFTAASFPLQTDSAFTDGAEQEKARLLEAVEQSLIEVVEPKGIATKIKERIKCQMKGWGSSWGMTAQALQQFQLIKKQALHDL